MAIIVADSVPPVPPPPVPPNFPLHARYPTTATITTITANIAALEAPRLFHNNISTLSFVKDKITMTPQAAARIYRAHRDSTFHHFNTIKKFFRKK
jgi:hypothetical protein